MENDTLTEESNQTSPAVIVLAVIGGVAVAKAVWRRSPVRLARRNRTPRKMVK